MSSSPARQWRQRRQAEMAARRGTDFRPCSGYEQMLLQLAEDKRRLKGVQSTATRAALKRDMLPNYAAWVAGATSMDSHRQDDVVLTVMVWRIDAGDYQGGLEVARYVLRQNWVMPFGKRNPQTVVAEELADAAQTAWLTGEYFDADLLLETISLTKGFDMPDQSVARLHKATGLLLSQDNPGAGLYHLKTALQRDNRCGVKKEILKIERRLHAQSC